MRRESVCLLPPTSLFGSPRATSLCTIHTAALNTPISRSVAINGIDSTNVFRHLIVPSYSAAAIHRLRIACTYSIIFILNSLLITSISAALPLDRCFNNSTERCFGNPINCQLAESTMPCDGLLIYSSDADERQPAKVIKLEIFGRSPVELDSGFYIAAGLSLDGKMNGSIIFECLRISNNVVVAFVSLALKNYEIPERLSPEAASVFNATGRQRRSNEVKCQFLLPNPLVIESQPTVVRDFSTQLYYLLISRGTIGGGEWVCATFKFANK